MPKDDQAWTPDDTDLAARAALDAMATDAECEIETDDEDDDGPRAAMHTRVTGCLYMDGPLPWDVAPSEWITCIGCHARVRAIRREYESLVGPPMKPIASPRIDRSVTRHPASRPTPPPSLRDGHWHYGKNAVAHAISPDGETIRVAEFHVHASGGIAHVHELARTFTEQARIEQERLLRLPPDPSPAYTAHLNALGAAWVEFSRRMQRHHDFQEFGYSTPQLRMGVGTKTPIAVAGDMQFQPGGTICGLPNTEDGEPELIADGHVYLVTVAVDALWACGIDADESDVLTYVGRAGWTTVAFLADQRLLSVAVS